MKIIVFLFGVLVQIAGIIACAFTLWAIVAHRVPHDREGMAAAIFVAGAVATSLGGRIADVIR